MDQHQGQIKRLQVHIGILPFFQNFSKLSTTAKCHQNKIGKH